jgi:hypothetical protein
VATAQQAAALTALSVRVLDMLRSNNYGRGFTLNLKVAERAEVLDFSTPEGTRWSPHFPRAFFRRRQFQGHFTGPNGP